MPRKVLTLVVVHQKDAGRVLLGMKKRGFGAGRWNGFGGKVEPGETVTQAAHRELREEAGITAEDLSHAGVVEFTYVGNPDVLEVHVFRASAIGGEPAESEEMRPHWFPVSAVPYGDMWPDDRHWLPLLFAGASFRGAFAFGEDGAIADMTLEVASFTVPAS